MKICQTPRGKLSIDKERQKQKKNKSTELKMD